MTFKLSELIKLPEKKDINKWRHCGGQSYYMRDDEAIGYNQALSDLANMEIEVDEEAIVKIIKPYWQGFELMQKGSMREGFICQIYDRLANPTKLAHAIASQLPKMIKRKE